MSNIIKTPDLSRLPEIDVERQNWIDAACSKLNLDDLRNLNLELVNVHSPMGFERELAELIVNRMNSAGIRSHLQVIDNMSANAIGRYGKRADGPTLMLYAPMDSHITFDPKIDLPWVGNKYRDDMIPNGYINDNGDVIGLCAWNPKAGIAAHIAALEAVIKAGIPIRGEIIAAFCGGGMPAHSDPSHNRPGFGFGSGVFHMVREGVTADFGLITKPINMVFWEEPGLAWFKITTHGSVMYAGLPHDMPGYSNTIADLAVISSAIEDWLPEYAEKNTSGQVKPEGALGALRAGNPSSTAIGPAAAELYVDIRITPRMTPLDAWRQLEEQLDKIRAANPGLVVTSEMVAAYPSASTDPNHWVVRSTTRAWEAVEGIKHPKHIPFSGQTDASLIRNLGIPLARIGMPFYDGVPDEWKKGIGGMGYSHIPDLEILTRKIIHVIVDSCTRSRLEIQEASA